MRFITKVWSAFFFFWQLCTDADQIIGLAMHAFPGLLQYISYQLNVDVGDVPFITELQYPLG
jgi:hypothetical protein